MEHVTCSMCMLQVALAITVSRAQRCQMQCCSNLMLLLSLSGRSIMAWIMLSGTGALSGTCSIVSVSCQGFWADILLLCCVADGCLCRLCPPCPAALQSFFRRNCLVACHEERCRWSTDDVGSQSAAGLSACSWACHCPIDRPRLRCFKSIELSNQEEGSMSLLMADKMCSRTCASLGWVDPRIRNNIGVDKVTLANTENISSCYDLLTPICSPDRCLIVRCAMYCRSDCTAPMANWLPTLL